MHFFYRMCTIDGLLTIQNRLCVPLCSYSREKSLLKASATVMTSRKLKLQLQKVSATVRLNILAKFILFVYFYAKSQVFRSFFLAYVRNILHFLWVYANLAKDPNLYNFNGSHTWTWCHSRVGFLGRVSIANMLKWHKPNKNVRFF